MALALQALRKLFATTSRRPTIGQIAATGARYQTAAALDSTAGIAAYAADRNVLTVPQSFAGVSSYGFSLAEPIIATIDARVPAPAVPLPAPWWQETAAFMTALEQLIVSEVADAGRTASQVEFVARPEWTEYVRVLRLPSCDRCTVLAGRVYKDLEAFDRHPGCDCEMWPIDSLDQARKEGLVASFDEAFEAGQVTGLSRADAQAITDGADPSVVVNAKRGTTVPGITNALRTETFGRKVKATTHGTTKRSQWRKKNPSRLVRLRPESIYKFAKDRNDAVRLLRLYGYIH